MFRRQPLPPRWSEVTALFGGRFDPPHLGHREAVRGLFENPGVKRVIVIPSASPPHKPTSAGVEDRAQMTHLNFKSTPTDRFPDEVQIDLMEVERARLEPQRPSYTFDTLQQAKPRYGSLAFVIGTDQLSQLHTWHRFPELLGQCHWIVLERKAHVGLSARTVLREWEASGLVQAVSENLWRIKESASFLTLQPTEAAAISSTEIRESFVRTGKPPENSMLPEVLAYLKVHKIYGI